MQNPFTMKHLTLFLKKGLSLVLIMAYGGVWSGMWTLPTTWAAVSSCSASVTPTSIGTNTTDTLQFSVTNTDSVNIRWVRLTAPSEAFEITTGSTAGWASTIESPTQIIFKFGTLGPGTSQAFSVTVQTGVTTQSSQAWTVEASDTTGGAAPYGCGGSTAVAIAPPSSPPVLSGITASSISATEATISWNTDKSADSVVAYGTTSGYGSVSSDTTLRTSHSRTVTGLAAATTYHYQVRSTDSTGNATTSADNTFTTAAPEAAPTPAPSPTPVTATTTIVTITPTPTPSSAPVTSTSRLRPTPTPSPEVSVISDTTGPIVQLRSIPTEPVGEAPAVTGAVRDDFGVARVQFSTDGGRNWLSVDRLTGAGEREALFSFTPRVTADGNYPLAVRAFDRSGNVGVSDSFELIIDQAPPEVGTALFSLGPQLLQPSQDGALLALPGLDYTVTLAARGGATSVDVHLGDSVHSLVEQTGTHLWTGTLHVTEPGLYTIVVQTRDGAGNVTERSLGAFMAVEGGQVVTESGQPVAGATVELHYFEAALNSFVSWRGAAFRQSNPQVTDEDGRFYFSPPAGTYYLSVTAPGIQTAQTTRFVVERPAPLTFSIPVAPARRFSWRATSVPVHMATVVPTTTHSLVAQPLPESITLQRAEGSAHILTVLSGWSPQASEQMLALTELEQINPASVTALVSEAPELGVRLWQARGHYEVPVITDPDGALQRQLAVTTSPLHFVLDPQGIVTAVVSGIVSASQFEGLLLLNN